MKIPLATHEHLILGSSTVTLAPTKCVTTHPTVRLDRFAKPGSVRHLNESSVDDQTLTSASGLMFA